MISRRRLRHLAISLILAAAVALVGSQRGVLSQLSPSQSSSSGRETVTLERIVDGDTIWVSGHRKIRLVGMNAPEVAHPAEGKPTGQPYGPEATEHLRSLLTGHALTLEKDVSETDRYGRLLRYVYADGVNTSIQMVRDGYAHTLTYPPDVKYSSEIRAAEADARTNRRGLWK